jgi:hypothetical protein
MIIEPHGECKQYTKDLNYYELRNLTTLVKEEDDELFRSIGGVSVFLMVEDHEICSLADEPTYSTIIQLHTRRLFVSLTEHKLEGVSRETPLITGTAGQMIGVLDLDISLANLQLPQHGVELISISMSVPVCGKHARLHSPGARYLHRGCYLQACFINYKHYRYDIHAPASNWQLRCYDVLRIEWEDGVAYRKAIGQVWKEGWDAADTEEAYIRLG